MAPRCQHRRLLLVGVATRQEGELIERSSKQREDQQKFGEALDLERIPKGAQGSHRRGARERVRQRWLATEIGEKLNLVGCHLAQLEKLGCVELVDEVPAQGGRVTEHLYRGVQRPYMSIDAWDGLTDVEKHRWAMTTMRLITEDIEKGMTHGTFLDPDDNHISRSPMVVDGKGWLETLAVLDRAVEDLIEVETRSSVRLEGSTEGEIFQKVEIIHFRSPVRV